MSMTNGHFSNSTRELLLAAEALRTLTPAFEEHNEQTRLLSETARRLLSLPYTERIERLRQLLLRYSTVIRRIGDEHIDATPRFREHVEAAVRSIETDLHDPDRIDNEEKLALIDSLTLLRHALRKAQSNLAYFRGALDNMPDFGLTEVTTTREDVRESLSATDKTFETLSERIWKLRNRLLAI